MIVPSKNILEPSIIDMLSYSKRIITLEAINDIEFVGWDGYGRVNLSPNGIKFIRICRLGNNSFDGSPMYGFSSHWQYGDVVGLVIGRDELEKGIHNLKIAILPDDFTVGSEEI
jgi:hypothetical protein